MRRQGPVGWGAAPHTGQTQEASTPRGGVPGKPRRNASPTPSPDQEPCKHASTQRPTLARILTATSAPQYSASHTSPKLPSPTHSTSRMSAGDTAGRQGAGMARWEGCRGGAGGGARPTPGHPSSSAPQQPQPQHTSTGSHHALSANHASPPQTPLHPPSRKPGGSLVRSVTVFVSMPPPAAPPLTTRKPARRRLRLSSLSCSLRLAILRPGRSCRGGTMAASKGV